MRTLKRIPALLVTLTLVACGGSNSAAGTWILDTTATLEANESTKAEMLAGVPEDQREAADKTFTDMFLQMEITMILADDGTVIGTAKIPKTIGGEAREQKTGGTWSADGDQVTIETAPEGGGNEGRVSATLSGDTLTATMPAAGGPPMTMVFKR